MSDTMDPATVLEEAADLLLIRGVCRDGSYGNHGGQRCALGAIAEASGVQMDHQGVRPGSALCFPVGHLPAARALAKHVAGPYSGVPVANIPPWNDGTVDDFEVIDTLRLAAKDIRNEAVG